MKFRGLADFGGLRQSWYLGCRNEKKYYMDGFPIKI